MAGVAGPHIPSGPDARAARWRAHVAGRRILLLDDAAGHEQVRPLLPGSAGSLVMVTSRRRLTALEDAAVISLVTLSPDEAAVLLARLACRTDPGSPAGPAGEIAQLCGYLPLAIGMLARQLRHPPARLDPGSKGAGPRLPRQGSVFPVPVVTRQQFYLPWACHLIPGVY
jgi:hypothetical protein